MTAKTHPDDMVKMLGELAREHGYGITEICLIGQKAVGDALPEHRYSAAFVSVPQIDGTILAVQAS